MSEDPRKALVQDYVRYAHAIGFTGILEAVHGHAYKTLCSERVSAYVIPRGHYKTTGIAEAGVLYTHVTDVRPESRGHERVMLCSSVKTKSLEAIEHQVEMLRGEITFPDGRKCRHFEAFPHTRVTRYKADYGYNIANRRGTNKDWSTYGIGMDGAQAGYHPTLIVNDDLVSEKTENSPTVLQKIQEKWYKQEQLLENAGCRRWNIWTPWVPGDLHEHVLDRGVIPIIVRPFWSGDPRPDMPDEFREEFVDESKGWTGWPLAPEIKNAAYYEACCDIGTKEYIPPHQRACFLDCEVPSKGRRVYEKALIDAVLHRGQGFQIDQARQLPHKALLTIDPGCVGSELSDPSGIVGWRVFRAKTLGIQDWHDGTKASPNELVWVLCYAEELSGGLDALHIRLPQILKSGPMDDATETGLENAGQQAGYLPGMRSALAAQGIKKHRIRVSRRVTSAMGKFARAGAFVTRLRTGRVIIPGEFEGRDLAISHLRQYDPHRKRDDVHDGMTISVLYDTSAEAEQEHEDVPKEGTLGHQMLVERKLRTMRS